MERGDWVEPSEREKSKPNRDKSQKRWRKAVLAGIGGLALTSGLTLLAARGGASTAAKYQAQAAEFARVAAAEVSSASYDATALPGYLGKSVCGTRAQEIVNDNFDVSTQASELSALGKTTACKAYKSTFSSTIPGIETDLNAALVDQINANANRDDAYLYKDILPVAILVLGSLGSIGLATELRRYES